MRLRQTLTTRTASRRYDKVIGAGADPRRVRPAMSRRDNRSLSKLAVRSRGAESGNGHAFPRREVTTLHSDGLDWAAALTHPFGSSQTPKRGCLREQTSVGRMHVGKASPLTEHLRPFITIALSARDMK
jgi:hypothetical protein